MGKIWQILKKILGVYCLIFFCAITVTSIFSIFNSIKRGEKISIILFATIFVIIPICTILGFLSYKLLHKQTKKEEIGKLTKSVIDKGNTNPANMLKNAIMESVETKSEIIEDDITEENSQATATKRIINETSFDKAKSIEELDRLSRLRSDKLLEERQLRISKFNPYDVKISSAPIDELSSTEKYFLQQMNGNSVENPNVYAYWTYEYSIDFSEIMTKLISNDFLRIGGVYDTLESLKVDKLKMILSSVGLPVSGKKIDLIRRIETSVDEEILEKILSNSPKTYVLTSKGKNALIGLPKSATKNIEFEDTCLDLISAGDVDGAYKLVCQNEINKIIPRGSSKKYWRNELKKGLSDYQIMVYSHFLESDISYITLNRFANFELEFKTCCIFAIMLGMPADEISKTFIRITNITAISKREIVSSLQSAIFAIMDEFQQNSFRELVDS